MASIPGSCPRQCGVASTSFSVFVPALPCFLHTRSPAGLRGCGQKTGHAFRKDRRGLRDVIVQAEKRPGTSSNSSPFGFEKQGTRWKVNLNNTEIYVTEKEASQYGMTAVLMFGGLALILGPLLIGLAISAVAVGFAFSVGAFALSTFLVPLMVVLTINFLIFGGLFGGAAVVGLSFFAPTALAAVIAVLGLGLGWTAVNTLRGSVPQAAAPPPPPPTSAASSSSSSAAPKGPLTIDVEAEVTEQEMKRMNKELREFDDLLADREELKRMEAWRKSRTKQ